MNEREYEMNRLLERDNLIVHCVNDLRKSEGASVLILCDNPDFSGKNNAIEVCDEWTGWKPRRFEANSLLEALQTALIARDNARRAEPPPPEPRKAREWWINRNGRTAYLHDNEHDATEGIKDGLGKVVPGWETIHVREVLPGDDKPGVEAELKRLAPAFCDNTHDIGLGSDGKFYADEFDGEDGEGSRVVFSTLAELVEWLREQVGE